MEKVSGVTLGTIIAFIAPGFIGLVAASYHLPIAHAWITLATDKDQTVGVFFFVLLASLTIGVILGGVRRIAIDPLFRKGFRRIPAIPRPEYDFAKLAVSGKLEAFEAIVENYYKYYQFYSNMFVAVIVLWVAHALSEGPSWPIGYHATLALLLVGLVTSAWLSLERYSTAASKFFAA